MISGIERIALAIWYMIALLIVGPLYARADYEEKLMYASVLLISVLYAFYKVMD